MTHPHVPHRTRTRLTHDFSRHWCNHHAAQPVKIVCAATQELLKINVAQGLQDTVNSQTFMGRCVIDINKFSKTPNVPVDDWYALSLQLQSDEIS